MVKPDPAFHKPVIQRQPKFEAVLNFISELNIVLSILILHPPKLCMALIEEEAIVLRSLQKRYQLEKD